MGEQTKNMLIGAFIIIACSLFVSFILFLRPRVGDEKQTLIFRFSDINNVGVGTRVLYAGKPVGEVTVVEEITNSRKQPVDEIGRVYIYQLIVKVDSSVQLYDTDEVTIQTSGLLGEKSIGIVPKAAPPGIKPKRITIDQPFYADAVDPLENALIQISDLAEEMERTFRLAADWIEDNEKIVTAALTNFGDAMGEVKGAIGQMREKEAFANISDVFKNLNLTTTNLVDGKGTLGKLVNQDDLYVRFSGIMSKVNIILNDISHYGLLYQSNKKWQRTRLKRVSLLHSLDTPEGFRIYFEDEMDRINLSMSRLSMLLERAEQSPEKETIMDSMSFKREFQGFKHDVEALSENLKLFNQQLSEATH